MNGRQTSGTSPATHWLAFAVFMLVVAGIFIKHLQYEYADLDAGERVRLAGQAQLVGKNIAHQLDSANRALESIRNDLSYLEKRKNGREELTLRLKDLTETMVGVSSMGVVDVQGRVVASSREGFIGQHFSHRSYYLIPQQNPDPEALYVSLPFKNALGFFSIALSRAIVEPDGRFGGVVVALLEPEEFSVLLDSVRYAPDMRASLVHGGGMLFTDIPAGEWQPGTNLAAKPGSFLERHMQSGQPASLLTGAIPGSGAERMVALNTVRPPALRMNHAMVVVLERDLPAVFFEWRREAWEGAGLLAVLLLVSGIALVFYQRRQRIHDELVERHEAERYEMAERLKLATEASATGVWEYDCVSRKQFWNDAMYALYGVNPEAFTADYSAWQAMILPEDIAEVNTAIGNVLEHGAPYDICFHIRRGDGQVRVIHALGKVIFDKAGKPLRAVGTNQDITERQNSEERLRQSKVRLRAYLDNISDTIWVIGANLDIVYVSPSVVRLLDTSPDELIGRPSALVIHPDDMEIVASAQRYVMEHPDEPHTVQYRVGRKDGSWMDVESTGVNMLDNPAISGVLVTMRDVTGRKAVEGALRESESRFREIFNAVSDAIFIHDAETGRILDVNRRMCEMYGFTREEALACSPDDLSAGVPPYSAAEAIGKIHLTRTAGPQTFEWLARTRDGRFFRVEVGLRFAHVGSQQCILATVRDISERKHMDAELRIAAIAFESRDGMLVANADSVILRVNHAFNGITGYTAAEAVGQTPHLLKSGRHDAAFYAAMWESIRNGGNWHGEVWNRRKNGEIYPAQLTITAVKGERGEVTHYVATMRDITERKAAEENIHTLAFYDALTGLPNRRLLDDRIRQAMATSRRSGLFGALMFLDLDNFKPLNDTCGHDAGDLLLKQAAHRIAACVRGTDTVARFGGDEFVVVLSELDENGGKSADQARTIAEKIRTVLAEPCVLEFRRKDGTDATIEHRCTSSIGVALFIGQKASPEDALKWADIAMYRAKEAGRNRVHFHGA